MRPSLKYHLAFWLLCLASSFSLFAQNAKHRYGDWTEPLFEDNVADFDASPGSFELSTSYGAYPRLPGGSPDIGWEVEAVFNEKIGIETGFYSNWSSLGGESSQTVATRMAFAFQYTLSASNEKAWATGMDLLSPGWSRYGQRKSLGWGIKPNLIYGRKWRGGFDSQWRLTPLLEFSADGLRVSGTAQGALFWQNDWLLAGTEFGGGMDSSSPFLFVAPQIGVSLSDFSVWAGWWQPSFFANQLALGYLSLSLCYNWERRF